MSDRIYTDTPTQRLWEAYWAGYKQGKNTESYSDIDRRAAQSRFERQFLDNDE